MIATMKNDQDARYSVVELCLALGVSRSGFYDHEQKPDCERRREDGVLAQKISLLFLEGRRTYGSRRIQKGLLREGIVVWQKADRSADERPGARSHSEACVSTQNHSKLPRSTDCSKSLENAPRAAQEA